MENVFLLLLSAARSKFNQTILQTYGDCVLLCTKSKTLNLIDGWVKQNWQNYNIRFVNAHNMLLLRAS
jgi:hypothetical protein